MNWFRETVWVKACPRCERGDMFQDSDIYGPFRQCFQCGYLQDLPAAEPQWALAGEQGRPVGEDEERELAAA